MKKEIYLTYNTFPLWVKGYDGNAMISAAEKRGFSVKQVDPNQMSELSDDELPYAAINMVGCTVEPHMRFLRDLELRGVKVVNPVFASRIADDKMLSYIELKNAKFPIPKTLDLNVQKDDQKNITEITNKLGFPCVVKVPNSGLGFGVCRVTNASDLYDLLGLVRLCTQRRNDGYHPTNLLVQEYIEESAGKAIRVVVVDSKCVGALYKTNELGWKTNSSNTGRKTVPYQIDPALEKLSIDVCKHLHLNFAGIDFHITKSGYLIGEVNSSPMLEHFESIYPNINVSELLLDFLMKE